MTTRGEINSNFYQIVFVDGNGNPTQVKPEYLANVPNANTANFANYANFAGNAFSVDVSNVVGIGNIATVNLTTSTSNVLYGNGVFAPIAAGANANYANFAGNAFSVDGANVVGDVANANHANISDVANSVVVGNVVGIGNIATINLDGNVSNVLLGDGTFGPGGGGNAANANYANFAGEAFSVTGSNVSGEVANANYASYAGNAFSVTGSNVSGEVANANYASYAGNAFSVTGSNVSGDVSGANHANIADSANSVAVGNVVGIGNIATSNFDGNGSNALLGNGVFGSIIVTSVANANYSNFAGQVVDSTQSNITSLGTLANLSVSGVTSLSSNVNMNGSWVGNIGYAVVDTDAASKLYVDTLVATGISYHQPVNAATTTTLATATSGTTAYNQPNGAGNGIGAYISTTGTFATIDGVTINGSTSVRILVKDEANLTWNGIYNYTNATAITRSTDADQAGVGNTQRLGINDYFFTQAGSVNAGTAFIVSAPAGTITFGTSNITFSIFSTSQVYTGGTGITVSGTVISANANQSQVTTVGTLTSLSVTGNINSAFINANGVGLTNLTGGNVVGDVAGANHANIADVANSVSGGNVVGDVAGANHANIADVANSVSGANVSGQVSNALVSGTVYTNAQPNITSTGILTSLSVTGNVNAAYFVGNGSALTSLTGGNVVGDVSGANHANIADVANSVAVGNVVGIGNIATSNFDGNGSNALLGNGIFGAITVSSVANANYANFAGTVITNAQPNITSLGTLTSLSVTGNVNASFFVGNGSALTGITATATPAGLNTYVQFNDAGVTGGNANLTFNKTTGILTTNILNSTITTGTAPLTVASSTLVPNLFVARSNRSDYVNVTNQTTGTDYNLTFVNGDGNVAMLIDTSVNGPKYSPNTETISSTEFEGKLVGTAGGSSYFDVAGSNANVVISGTVRLSVNSTGILSNGTVTATRLISNIAVGTAPLTVTSTTQVANLTAEFSNIANVANSVAVANVVGIGNIATSNFDGNSSNALLGNGVFGAITVGTVANANYAAFAGNVTISAQPNITSLGILTSLSVSGNINAGFINANGVGLTNITAANVVGEVANANYAGYAGNVTIAAQSNITSVGTLASLSVSGSATVGNIISTGLGNVANVLFTKYNETVVSGGSVSGTLTPNAAAGTIYNYTLTGSITINSLANAVAGTGMTIILTQGGSGSYTLTSTMKFLGGTKTLSTSVGAIDIVSVFYDGTNYYATLGKGFA